MSGLKRWGILLLVVIAGILLVGRAGPSRKPTVSAPAQIQAAGLPADALAVAQQRGLSPDDVTAALSTYLPTGRHDEYVMFASGGHSGQMLAIGLPSMRLLKAISVFTPEPWQGAGYGVKESPLGLGDANVTFNGQPLTWGDAHHPALSETNGEYDGQYLFIGDKANGRLAVIDLRDFETKQIIKNPVFTNNHGAAFVTPNTEYVIEGSQFAVPLGNAYAPLDQYQQVYRGIMMFWKFDRARGRIVPEESFAVELPPYWQDLADSGKLASEGWAFVNSFNSEMATGGIEEGNPPFEAGTAERDMDYLHILNRKKAEQLIAEGKFNTVNGIRIIPLSLAASEGVLSLAPEPKSPHGVDICPCGRHIVVGGKLDPHVTIYTIDRIVKAIADKDYEGLDPFGVPILRFDAVKEAQVELGLGPLHTQFDNQGYAYTSMFLDSTVARWTLGSCKFKAPEPEWSLVSAVPVHYNVGHIAAAEGDTVSPDGRYLVALNKWSVDRFLSVGPLLPQNLQLIDISRTGDTQKVLYDMPIGNGEPHYAQIIKADKLKAWEVYPEVGWDSLHQVQRTDVALEGSVTDHGDLVEVNMTAIRSHFDPERVRIKQGQHVRWRITNLERTRDATHGFTIPGYNIAASIEPGETVTVEFVAHQSGVYPFYCLEFCSALHLEMAGYFLIEPAEAAPAPTASAAPVAGGG